MRTPDSEETPGLTPSRSTRCGSRKDAEDLVEVVGVGKPDAMVLGLQGCLLDADGVGVGVNRRRRKGPVTCEEEEEVLEAEDIEEVEEVEEDEEGEGDGRERAVEVKLEVRVVAKSESAPLATFIPSPIHAAQQGMSRNDHQPEGVGSALRVRARESTRSLANTLHALCRHLHAHL